jgi:hypothetical protein
VATFWICGVKPTVCGSQPFSYGKRGGGLETPPYTDAVQHGFHLHIEIVDWNYLTENIVLRSPHSEPVKLPKNLLISA